MALTYLQEGMTRPATFSLFTRNLPPDRGFLVAAGLEDALAYLERLRVDDSDVAALASALGRPDDEVTALRDLHFTGDVWAVPEGRVVLAGEPLLEVTAPLPQAHLVETFLLNQLTYQTATSRCAAPTAPRQGCAARAGALVGFAGTGNVAVSLAYGLPAVGTMAHSFVEAFTDEGEAFRALVRNTSGPMTLTGSRRSVAVVRADVARLRKPHIDARRQ